MFENTSEQLAKTDPLGLRQKPVYNTVTFSDIQSKDIELPKKVIGDLIYLNELTVLFAYSGRGKSIIAFQIAHCVATGSNLDLGNNISLVNECNPMNVIYFDYEMKEVQVKDRLGSKELPDNLYRSSLNRGENEGENPKEIFERIKCEAERVNAKFIVIDNMSKISSIDLTKGNEVKSFLEPLHQLSLYDGYTILLIGHTTLSADAFIPLEKKHLFGSSYIGNYMDAMVGIGMTNSDEKQYYIKQLKTRINAEVYGGNNVIHVYIDKDKDNFTRYFGIETCNEMDLLSGRSINTERAPNREFYTIAEIYYNSARGASNNLKKVGIEAPNNTISYNVKAFRDVDNERYEKWKSYDKKEQYSLLMGKSPNGEFMPKIHTEDDETEIAF
ncbi:AAA family ATPase [Aestuariivivens sediminicola]|uniref:AAA family ATPase n=1 Tax=Aestuariivivens sediminicola TaxID=2913560 RepID=UPI001F58E397|nr:AAA family ATPase [Aestuariivivens sediminicola]